MSAGVFVIAETSPAGLTPGSVKTISFARRLADAAGEGLLIIVPGCFAGAEPTGGAETILLIGASLDAYSAEAWHEALTPLCRELAPRFLCLPHTSRGWDYGPGLAIRLEAALIGAVEGFRREGGDFLFRRSILKGQWQQEVRPERLPVVLTVLPEAAADGDSTVANIYAAPGQTETTDVVSRAKASDDPTTKIASTGETAGETVTGVHSAIIRTVSAIPDPRCRPLGKLPAGETAYDFSAAEVIVAAGQGIGAAENMDLIQRLAGLFPKAAVGCSRAACDRGWMECRRQIGMTGRTVAPPLYIACGISGAMPHLAGMRDSRCIIAVNRDKNAAIFQVAHLGVVADLLAFIPTVLEEADRSAPGA